MLNSLFLNHLRPKESTDKENQVILNTREATDPTELSKLHADKVLQNLSKLVPAKFTWTEKTVKLIKVVISYFKKSCYRRK